MADWHPEDIKSAVRKRGVTLADIARGIGIRRNALCLALALPRAEAELAIAAALDLHPMEIWPSRYNPDGSRKRPQPADNYRAEARFGNGNVGPVPQNGARA